MVRPWGGWIPWILKRSSKVGFGVFPPPWILVIFFWGGVSTDFPNGTCFWCFFIATEKLRGVFLQEIMEQHKDIPKKHVCIYPRIMIIYIYIIIILINYIYYIYIFYMLYIIDIYISYILYVMYVKYLEWWWWVFSVFDFPASSHCRYGGLGSDSAPIKSHGQCLELGWSVLLSGNKWMNTFTPCPWKFDCLPLKIYQSLPTIIFFKGRAVKLWEVYTTFSNDVFWSLGLQIWWERSSRVVDASWHPGSGSTSTCDQINHS